MRIPAERIAQIDSAAPSYGFKAPRISLPGKMRRVKTAVHNQIEEHHQGAFVLFEEALKFIIAFEAFQFTRTDRPKEVLPFLLALARVRADLISIRHLLQAGQETSALAIARIFMEDIELAMATAVDPEFAINFMETETPNSFWSKNIAHGNIYPYLERFLQLGNPEKGLSEAHIAHHKMMKSFLSQHIHPTFRSAWPLVTPVALEHPGLFAAHPMGWFGESSGRLCLYIANEIQVFSVTCINTFTRPNPPPALANYKPSKAFTTFMRPAHNLQTLLTKYSKKIYSEYGKKSAHWKTAIKSSE